MTTVSQHPAGAKAPAGLLARLRRARQGAAAAEFALILPVMLMVVAGALQYGVMAMTYNAMLNGARSGARALSLGDAAATDVRTAVRDWMPAWVPAADVTVTSEAVGANQVRVNVSVPGTSSTVFRLLPLPATLDVSVQMMLED